MIRSSSGLLPPASRVKGVVLSAFALLVLATSAFAETVATPDQIVGRAAIVQKLNTQIPLNVMLRDEEGRVVRVGDYFNHGRPVVLNFVYYRCPMLCPLVLNGMTEALTNLKFDIGKEFEVVTVSIDPRDTPTDAAKMKEKYIKHYGRLDSEGGWHFLTGPEGAVKKLADATGFQYAYDEQRNQFAHGAAILILTADGHISRYFYGFEFKPRDLRLAIVEASQGKIGDVSDQFLLLCYHYDPAIGKYSRDAMMFARAGGITTMLVLGGFIFVMFRKERHGRSSETTRQ